MRNNSGSQLDTPRKRPMSQFVDKKAQPLGDALKFRPPPPPPYNITGVQPNPCASSTDPAPPPPPRTVSKTVDALPGYVSSMTLWGLMPTRSFPSPPFAFCSQGWKSGCPKTQEKIVPHRCRLISMSLPSFKVTSNTPAPRETPMPCSKPQQHTGHVRAPECMRGCHSTVRL